MSVGSGLEIASMASGLELVPIPPGDYKIAAPVALGANVLCLVKDEKSFYLSVSPKDLKPAIDKRVANGDNQLTVIE